jgi:cytochrome c biogenesis protein CcmG, thiol:disulfide interchange protein DsbE
MRIIPTFLWLCCLFFLGKIAVDRLLNPTGNDLVGRVAKQIVTTKIDGYQTVPDDLTTVEHEVILLNFFASWCAPCKQEHPLLLKLAKDYQVTLIGVVTRDSAKRVQDFLSDAGNPYDYLGIDKMDATIINFGLKGVPETYLMNKNGEILAYHSGVLSDEVIASKFSEYLQLSK